MPNASFDARPASAVYLLLAIALAGCGGGDCEPTEPLVVTAATPSSETPADVRVVPTVIFSHRLSKPSVNAHTVTLRSAVAKVDAKISAVGSTVTVTPETPLVWGSHYTLTLSEKVMDIAGHPLAAPFDLRFDTRTPTWSATGTLASRDSATFVYGLAFDGLGNAFATWNEFRSGGWVLMAARRGAKRNAAWSQPVTVAVGHAMGGDGEVAADAAGNAIATWWEASKVYAARYDADLDSWSSPVAIGTGGNPRIAMDAAGNATVIWSLTFTNPTQIYAARYTAHSGRWLPARRLSGALSASEEQVQMNAAGHTMVVWTDDRVHVASYDAATAAWSESTVLDAGAGKDTTPRISINMRGDAAAVWLHDKGDGKPAVAVGRYAASNKAWNSVDVVSIGSGRNFEPKVAIDSAANVTVLWLQAAASNIFTVNSARYENQTRAWRCLPLVDESNFGLSFIDLQVDAAGNASAAWSHGIADGIKSRKYFSRYIASGPTASWSQPIDDLASDGYGNTAVGPSGQLMTVWSVNQPGMNATGELKWRLLSGDN